jgi:hypothetical protein
MKSSQISVAFFSYKLNNNYKLNNYNLKFLTYLLGKSGFYNLFKGILTYVLS